MIVGYYCAGVLDDGDVIIWCVGTKLPLLRISSPLSEGQLLSRGSTFMPIIRNVISVDCCIARRFLRLIFQGFANISKFS